MSMREEMESWDRWQVVWCREIVYSDRIGVYKSVVGCSGGHDYDTSCSVQ